MSDPFGFLDALFGGDGGGGYPSTQGGPRLDQGFSPVAGWMVGQAFANAGPVGQYLGLLYGSPGTGIPSIRWASYHDYGDYIDFTGGAYDPDFGGRAQVVNTSDSAPSQPAESRTLEAPSQPGESRTLEVLDRGDSGSARPNERIDVVHVLGTPPDRPSGKDWWPGMEAYLSLQRNRTFSGSENQIRWADPPPIRPPRPRRPAVRNPSRVDPQPPAPEQPQPEPNAVVDVGPSTVPYSDRVAIPWLSDASVPEQLLPWGSWERPENVPSPRWERGDTGRIENVPTVPIERSFWNRGGTGLVLGAGTAAAATLVVLFWWNPIGWVAGASLALAIAGGTAATIASAVELGGSYGGVTSQEQDASANRAISATLGYTSVGGVIGGVVGTVFADDAQEGFEAGTLWGGLFEGATSLPGALRALPGLWRAGLPWAKSLLLTPAWFYITAGSGGGGNVRSLARVFTAQGRIASRVRTVEYLGTTPLLERDKAWARYQVFVTRTRQEAVYRITYVNGEQRLVRADRGLQGGRSLVDAKEGDLGQMFNLEHEAHIIRQVDNYVDITTVTGGTAGYRVSTQLGAYRLTQRFGLEYPAELASGQLWINWVPWRRR